MPCDTALERQNEILADRLAKAVVYLQAIENIIVRVGETDLSWFIGSIVNKANSEIYANWRHEPWAMESLDVVSGALFTPELSIIDTEEYRLCLSSLRQMVTDELISHPTDSAKATG